MNPLQAIFLKLIRVEVPVAPLKPINLPSREISLAKWRSDESQVAASMALARHHTYMAQLGVLEFEHPRFLALKLEASIEERAILQARAEGYQMAINNLHSMSVPLKVKTQVQSTFEPAEQAK